MAFFDSVKWECDKRNRKNRNVREYRGALNLRSYWDSLPQRNALITGGTEYSRNQVLAAAVRSFRARNAGPILVLNGSPACEESLIALASDGELGRLVVTSPAYRNYDLFWGMPAEAIRQLFETEAQRRGIADVSSLGDYAEAFLFVLKCRYAPSFHSILAMARESDNTIAALGQSYQVNPRLLNCIKDGVAGSAFRRILVDFGKAFLNIQSPNPTRMSVSNLDDSNSTYLIWTGSELQSIFNEILARELRYLRESKRMDYLLVINDINMGRSDPLLGVLSAAKRRGKLCICASNIMNYAEDEESKGVFLNDFPTLAVLNSGAEDYADQKKVLEKFGQYMHYEQVVGVGGGMELFQLPGRGAPHVGMTHYERPRVMVEDLARYSIAVRGNNGDTVSLYRTIGNA